MIGLGMNPKTRLSYQFSLVLGILLTVSTIFTLIVFLGIQDDLSADEGMSFFFAFTILLVFWPLLTIYSIIRLKGGGNRTLDKIFDSGAFFLMESGLGVLVLIFPSLMLITMEGLGFELRMTIIILNIVFWGFILYFLLKMKKRRPKRRRPL